MADRTLVTGLFPDRDSAELAYRALALRGYSRDDVNVVMSDETRRRHFGDGEPAGPGTRAAEGAGIGGAIGGTIGAITAVGTSLAIPGLGLVLAGPVAAALAGAGAGAGAATGGLVGALIGWGIPEERVRRYEEGVRQGGILMGVRPRSAEDAAQVERAWRDEYRAGDVYR